MNGVQRQYLRDFLAHAGVTKSELSGEDLWFIFDALTCKGQETMDADKIHGWDVQLSHNLNVQDYRNPVVDLQILMWEQEGKLELDMSRRWPDGKSFAICLTHDVDSIREPNCWDILRYLPIFGRQAGSRLTVVLLLTALKRGLRFWKRQDLHFEKWLEVENQYGFTSSFFFLPSPISKPRWSDNFYSYTDTMSLGDQQIQISDFMRFLLKNGWDVGIHGTHACASDVEACKDATRKVGSAAGHLPITIRQHHLFFDVIKTPSILEKSGIRVDSSLGSNKDTIFRTRTALPHFLFDRQQGKPTEVLEIPLVIQDYAIYAPSALGLKGTEAMEHIKIMIDRIAEVRGAGAVLWHPDYGGNGEIFEAYKDLLAYIHDKGGWGCSARELANWWLRSDRIGWM